MKCFDGLKMEEYNIKLIFKIVLFAEIILANVIVINKIWCTFLWIPCYYTNNIKVKIYINVVTFSLLIGSQIVGLIGVIKKVKCLLIPSIIAHISIIVIWAIFLINFIDVLRQSPHIPQLGFNDVVIFCISLCVTLVIPVIFLNICLEYYKELDDFD